MSVRCAVAIVGRAVHAVDVRALTAVGAAHHEPIVHDADADTSSDPTTVVRDTALTMVVSMQEVSRAHNDAFASCTCVPRHRAQRPGVAGQSQSKVKLRRRASVQRSHRRVRAVAGFRLHFDLTADYFAHE